jgi:alkanesulfonate monooxygenase SsuD/methylene tetrahydromethanopterin reductase-like flavin-dependent oxidoreductase (luciferase family)
MNRRSVQFGVITIQSVSWDEMVRRWQHVEELGFDSVWVGDHWVNFMEPHTPWFEAWTLLAGLARHTTQIRIGPLISPVTFHHPAILARKALTVDHLSNGRLVLGMGAGLRGDRDPSYSMTGIEDWPAHERVERLAETVDIVDLLLRNEVATYEGAYYQIREAVMLPRPVQKPRPPITIAAGGPRMRKLAARVADTWNCVRALYPDTQESYQYLRTMNGYMSDICEVLGRSPSSLRRSVLHFHREPGMEFPFDSADQCGEILERIMDIGFNEVILQYPYYEDQIPRFEQVATEVLPKLRRKSGKDT